MSLPSLSNGRLLRNSALLLLCLTGALLLGKLDGWAALEDREQEPLLREFMRGKLEASQQVLEGLMTEDFDLIAQGSDKLTEISSAARWRISNDAMYRQHTAEFQRIAKQLKEAAQEKKMDSASLAYVGLTMNCIECHRFVRGIAITELAPPNSLFPASQQASVQEVLNDSIDPQRTN